MARTCLTAQSRICRYKDGLIPIAEMELLVVVLIIQTVAV